MPHPLEQKIVALRRRVRRMVAVYGLSVAAAALVGTMAALGLIDYLLRFQDRGLRIIASLLVLGVLAWSCYRYVFSTLLTRLRDTDLASCVERRFPSLGDRLVSAVEFLHAADDGPAAGSTALRQAMVAATTAESERLDFAAVLDRRPTDRAVAALVAACLVAGGFVVLDPLAAQIAMARLVNPFGSTAWPQMTHLAIRQPVTRVARGRTFQIEVVDAQGARLPSEVRIHYRFDAPDAEAVEETDRLRYAEGKMTARRESILRPFSYQVEGGDDQSLPWIDVQVVEPPAIKSVSVRLIPPAYTGWPPVSSQRHIHALEGTRVEISATAARPLKSATLCFEGGGKVPAQLGGDGTTLAVAFTVEKSGSYWFDLTDREGLYSGSDDRWEIRATAHPPPTVTIEQPTANLFVTPRAVVPLRVEAKDNLAVHDVALVFRRADAEPETTRALWASTVAPHANPLPKGVKKGTGSEPTGVNGADSGRHEVPVPLFQQQGAGTPEGDRRVVDDRWDLGPLELKPGMRVTFYATASDYRPQTSKSEPRSLTIIGMDELQDRLAAREKLILAELERVLTMQRGCRGQLESLRGSLAAQPHIGRREIDLLQAIQYNQREASRALTSRGEGVPMHILALLADLENNRLQSEDIGPRMAALLDQLDRLGQERLPAIARELTAAAKTAQVQREQQDHAAHFGRQVVASLAVAREQQDAVIAALEQMIGQLARWDSYRRFLADMSQLLRDQQALAQRTAEVGRRTLTQQLRDLAPPDVADLKAAAGRQLELARLLDRILRTMDQAGDELRQNDPSAAKTIAAAVDQIRRLATSQRMRTAGEQIGQNQIGQAAAGQKQIGQDLQEVLDRLALSRRPAADKATAEEIVRLEEDIRRLSSRQQGARDETKRLDGQAPHELSRSEALALRELAKQQHAIQSDAVRLGERFAPGGALAAALKAAAENMHAAGTLLDDRRTGSATQGAQQHALGHLDALIKAMESAKSAASAASKSQPSAYSAPHDAAQSQPDSSQNKAAAKAGVSSSPRPAGDGQARKPDRGEMRAMIKRVWGGLPERARQQMLQAPVEQFPPKYEVLIEEYFRRLSEEKGK